MCLYVLTPLSISSANLRRFLGLAYGKRHPGRIPQMVAIFVEHIRDDTLDRPSGEYRYDKSVH